MVPAGGATIVEFKLEVPGRYILVDHALSRLERGLAGFLVVEGADNPDVFHSDGPEHERPLRGGDAEDPWPKRRGRHERIAWVLLVPRRCTRELGSLTNAPRESGSEEGMKTDVVLKADVLDELEWEPSVNSTGIGVAVKDGVVTLSGEVASYQEKLQAERAALRVEGVKGAANEIEIHLPGTSHRSDGDIARAAVASLTWRARSRQTVSRSWSGRDGSRWRGTWTGGISGPRPRMRCVV